MLQVQQAMSDGPVWAFVTAPLPRFLPVSSNVLSSGPLCPPSLIRPRARSCLPRKQYSVLIMIPNVRPAPTR